MDLMLLAVAALSGIAPMTVLLIIGFKDFKNTKKDMVSNRRLIAIELAIKGYSIVQIKKHLRKLKY